MRHLALSDGTLWLSPPNERDIDEIARLCRHSSIGEWTTVPVPYHRADAVAFVEDIVPAGWAEGSPTWAIRLADDGLVVGMIGLSRYRNDRGAAEIGYWLAPVLRGGGLMTRAVNMACDYAFSPDGLRIDRVEWRAFVGNRASAAVVRRAGFHYEGLLRHGSVQRGVRRDAWVAARLRADSTPPPPWPPNI